MLGKKGQVGETISWFVATLIIIVILTISIFSASSLSKLNKVLDFGDSKENKFFRKSMQGYLLTKYSSGGTFFEKIEEEDNFNEITEEFGRRIFNQEEPFILLRLRKGSTIFNSIKESVSGVEVREVLKIEEGLNLELVTNGGPNEKIQNI